MSEAEEIAYISELLFKRLQNQCAPAEEEALQEWMARSQRNRELADHLLKGVYIQTQLQHISQTKDLIESKLAAAGRRPDDERPPHFYGNHLDNQKKTRKLWKGVAVAASLLIIGTVAVYLHQNNFETTSGESIVFVADDVPPGGNRATLTLADGSSIDLSDDHEGIVIDSDMIKYNDGTEVNPLDGESALLTLITPKGGQYQVTLPDGTKVWLNAASSMRYPGRFVGNKRIVELSGEAYFEVTPNPEQPFVVKSAMQEVTVLGTHFNINAYADEATAKTTLLEGSVRVFAVSPGLSPSSRADDFSTILTPNQQSIVSTGAPNIEIQTIDPMAAIDWKNGYFIFKDEGLESIMRKIGKWYDVDVVYEQTIDATFIGQVSRSRNISVVLHALAHTGNVSFKLEGNTVIVKRGKK